MRYVYKSNKKTERHAVYDDVADFLGHRPEDESLLIHNYDIPKSYSNKELRKWILFGIPHYDVKDLREVFKDKIKPLMRAGRRDLTNIYHYYPYFMKVWNMDQIAHLHLKKRFLILDDGPVTPIIGIMMCRDGKFEWKNVIRLITPLGFFSLCSWETFRSDKVRKTLVRIKPKKLTNCQIKFFYNLMATKDLFKSFAIAYPGIDRAKPQYKYKIKFLYKNVITPQNVALFREHYMAMGIDEFENLLRESGATVKAALDTIVDVMAKSPEGKERLQAAKDILKLNAIDLDADKPIGKTQWTELPVHQSELPLPAAQYQIEDLKHG